jgi:hypothetical protein
MNFKETVHSAAVRALTLQGMTERVAEAIIGRAFANQGSEWDRIVERCRRDDVSRVYVVVKHEGDTMVDAFVYAPDAKDNIRHVIDFASQGPDIGSGPGELVTEPAVGYYRVSFFDVAAEVKKALQASA